MLRIRASVVVKEFYSDMNRHRRCGCGGGHGAATSPQGPVPRDVGARAGGEEQVVAWPVAGEGKRRERGSRAAGGGRWRRCGLSRLRRLVREFEGISNGARAMMAGGGQAALRGRHRHRRIRSPLMLTADFVRGEVWKVYIWQGSWLCLPWRVRRVIAASLSQHPRVNKRDSNYFRNEKFTWAVLL